MLLWEHDLFRKPVPSFRDHALAARRTQLLSVLIVAGGTWASASRFGLSMPLSCARDDEAPDDGDDAPGAGAPGAAAAPSIGFSTRCDEPSNCACSSIASERWKMSPLTVPLPCSLTRTARIVPLTWPRM